MRRPPRGGRPITRAVRWRWLGYLPALLGYAQVRRRLGVPRPVSLVAAYGAPLAVALALPRGRGRHRAAAVWLAHMWAYKQAFEIPFDDPDKLRRRLRIDPPIRADAVIGRGMPPGQRLQSVLRQPPRLSPLDRVLTVVYLAWEMEPHAALFWILWRHPRRFPAAALRLGATFDATVFGYFLIPTAPPWWASEKAGRLNGEVHRVTVEVIRALRNKSRPAPSHESGSNPWASMPSDHFASAVSTAVALSEADPRAGAIGWSYAVALGVALVYTGEHYVVDLLAGAILAGAVHGALAVGSRPRAPVAFNWMPGLRRRRCVRACQRHGAGGRPGR